MSKKSFVIVFPSIFAKNKIPLLIANIKKILKLQNLKFNSVKRDGDIILVEANDPVFASSAINMLFGIKRIAIARQIKNNFDTIVSEITSLGGNLLLKGEKFLVRVEGTSKGFLPKDLEIAATSSIIEKKSKLGARPGTDKEFDKLVYSYLTKNNAYVCIFIDEGLGGVPYGIQEQIVISCVFDELSAINALNTIKHGYKTKLVVCYKKKSELMNLVKTINQIIPRLMTKKIELGFFHINLKKYSDTDYPILIAACLEVSLKVANNEKIKHISVPVTPTIISGKIIDEFVKKIVRNDKIPIIPLFGSNMQIFNDLQELGLSNKTKKLESLASKNFKKVTNVSEKLIQESLRSEKTVTVEIGPNNVHDILDALE